MTDQYHLFTKHGRHNRCAHVLQGCVRVAAAKNFFVGAFDAFGEQLSVFTFILSGARTFTYDVINRLTDVTTTDTGTTTYEYDAASQSYWLPDEHANWLTRDSEDGNFAVFMQYIPMMGTVEEELVACFERGGWVRRFAPVLPYAGVVVAWRLIWTNLGYGIHGIGLYVDPVNEPLRYLSCRV